jgi:hypothetical protein
MNGSAGGIRVVVQVPVLGIALPLSKVYRNVTLR